MDAHRRQAVDQLVPTPGLADCCFDPGAEAQGERELATADSSYVGPRELLRRSFPGREHDCQPIRLLDLSCNGLGAEVVVATIHQLTIDRNRANLDVHVVESGFTVPNDEVRASPVTERSDDSLRDTAPMLVAQVLLWRSGNLDLGQTARAFRSNRKDRVELAVRIRARAACDSSANDAPVRFLDRICEARPALNHDDHVGSFVELTLPSSAQLISEIFRSNVSAVVPTRSTSSMSSSSIRIASNPARHMLIA
jgi:hypothetical protein